ncbi:MAG TPA: hypothetical protein VJU84_00880 [Pyrinomonadaceae bacterium]|nr:hypothetical protein [Pyrinomonadaceae bacterium]
MKFAIAGLWLVTCVLTADSQIVSPTAAYLREHSQTPVNYVISKAVSHRITIMGEGHWLKQDVELIEALIPLLQKADIDLATELLPASEQPRIDKLIAGSKWDELEANAIMRTASWPYREYRDLLRAAWSVNHGSERPIKVLGLAPSDDWRKVLLPRGETYDSFMADLVTKHVRETSRRVVVYCGHHHAFTRYYQAELNKDGSARAYMDRTGNILSRRFGEQVFLITLHKPIWCGSPSASSSSYCLPFGGKVDCEATKVGHPIGFDVKGSPLADLRFEPADYYLYGHPGLRFVDFTDGYIWSGPIESLRSVTLIPLNEYAPDDTSMRQVAHSNPFNGEADVSVARLKEIWAGQAEARRDIMTNRKWKHLAGWQSRCQ